MTRRAAGRRGFILAEALVSVAIAGLAAAMSLTLLVWASRAIGEAQARQGAVRAMETLYEQARLLAPGQLRGSAGGRMGRYAWSRSGFGPIDRRGEDAPQQVRIEVRWSAGGQPRMRGLDAVILPGGGGSGGGATS